MDGELRLLVTGHLLSEHQQRGPPGGLPVLLHKSPKPPSLTEAFPYGPGSDLVSQPVPRDQNSPELGSIPSGWADSLD